MLLVIKNWLKYSENKNIRTAVTKMEVYATPCILQAYIFILFFISITEYVKYPTECDTYIFLK